MIMPYDIAYQETKLIMLGKQKLKPEFVELADWISNRYQVKVINIIYDTIDDGARPRLNICCEFESDRHTLLYSEQGTFASDKQEEISNQFKVTVANTSSYMNSANEYLTNNTWVIYSAFEPVARIEANQDIPSEKVDDLIRDLNNEDLWKIVRAFSGVTFFLFTDKQVKQYENREERKVWTNSYFALLQEYDEFGYFKRKSFTIQLDSKENFDTNYESNWYHYNK